MRQYEHIWIKLKEAHEVQLVIPRQLHNKIIKALNKESAKDVAFRFKCIEQDKSYRLSIVQFNDILRLSLIFRDTMPPSFVVTPEKLERRKKWWTPHLKKFRGS